MSLYEKNAAPAERTAEVSSKMAAALTEAWMRGEHKLVRATILGAVGSDVRKRWQNETAAALPESQRKGFRDYMGALYEV